MNIFIKNFIYIKKKYTNIYFIIKIIFYILLLLYIIKNNNILKLYI
jgi:hypothetical protein